MGSSSVGGRREGGQASHVDRVPAVRAEGGHRGGCRKGLWAGWGHRKGHRRRGWFPTLTDYEERTRGARGPLLLSFLCFLMGSDDFSGSSVVQATFQCRGIWVGSMVEKLRSLMPCGKKKRT